MSYMEQNLVEHIVSAGNVQWLISDRLYSLTLPQDCELPACTYQLIQRQPRHEHGDEIQYEYLFQVDSWGKSYSDVKQVALNLRSLLDGYKGPIGAAQECQIFLRDERDEYEDSRALRRVSQDFFIFVGQE